MKSILTTIIILFIATHANAKEFIYGQFYEASSLRFVVEYEGHKDYFFMDKMDAMNEAGEDGWEIIIKENDKYLVKKEIRDPFIDELLEERDRYKIALQKIKDFWINDATVMYGNLMDIIWHMFNIAQDALSKGN